MSGILALDLSSVVGWAFGQLDDPAPTFGTWHLREPTEGGRYAAFENEIAAAMDLFQPTKMVIEAPLSFQALLGVSTGRVMMQQYTLRGIALAEAWRASCAPSEVSSDIVRLTLLGQSRFAKDTVKREVVRYCWRRGLKVQDHNAGDAVMVWLWHVGQVRGAPRVAGPLFQEGRIQ